jgi:hypothetical protein
MPKVWHLHHDFSNIVTPKPEGHRDFYLGVVLSARKGMRAVYWEDVMNVFTAGWPPSSHRKTTM